MAMFYPAGVKAAFFFCVLAALALAACEQDKSKLSDAELHLTREQAQGRKVFNEDCAICHSAYTSKKLNGPSLKGLYKKKAMPSGAPPTDERIRATIDRGRGMMPGFGGLLSPQEVEALLAYLKTL